MIFRSVCVLIADRKCICGLRFEFMLIYKIGENWKILESFKRLGYNENLCEITKNFLGNNRYVLMKQYNFFLNKCFFFFRLIQKKTLF